MSSQSACHTTATQPSQAAQCALSLPTFTFKCGSAPGAEKSPQTMDSQAEIVPTHPLPPKNRQGWAGVWATGLPTFLAGKVGLGWQLAQPLPAELHQSPVRGPL